MDVAPSWFVAFMKEMRQDFRDLSMRVAALEADTTKSKTNQPAIKAIREEVDALSHAHALTEPCEVMISGVPTQLTHNEVVHNVATALDLSSASKFIIETRDWKEKTSKAKNLEMFTPQPGHNRSLRRGSSSIGDTNRRSVVLKLSSTCVRDTFIFRDSKLAKTNAQTVFSTGGSSRIFIHL